uniref:Uncharacterized protein n=1 Tax=Raphanus sativus TaxID=3726 RepID=A0A650GC81_RAPSA|nr:hypothetical protein [Raphanus sativus]
MPPSTHKLPFSSVSQYWRPTYYISTGGLSSLCLRTFLSIEGFNPAAGSPTATLLRLHPSRRSHRDMLVHIMSGIYLMVTQTP